MVAIALTVISLALIIIAVAVRVERHLPFVPRFIVTHYFALLAIGLIMFGVAVCLLTLSIFGSVND